MTIDPTKTVIQSRPELLLPYSRSEDATAFDYLSKIYTATDSARTIFEKFKKTIEDSPTIGNIMATNILNLKDQVSRTLFAFNNFPVSNTPSNLDNLKNYAKSVITGTINPFLSGFDARLNATQDPNAKQILTEAKTTYTKLKSQLEDIQTLINLEADLTNPSITSDDAKYKAAEDALRAKLSQETDLLNAHYAEITKQINDKFAATTKKVQELKKNKEATIGKYLTLRLEEVGYSPIDTYMLINIIQTYRVLAYDGILQDMTTEIDNMHSKLQTIQYNVQLARGHRPPESDDESALPTQVVDFMKENGLHYTDKKMEQSEYDQYILILKGFLDDTNGLVQLQTTRAQRYQNYRNGAFDMITSLFSKIMKSRDITVHNTK